MIMNQAKECKGSKQQMSDGETMKGISSLLDSINEATNSMSRSFQETILRHEQHFIRTYRIKMSELVKLYEQLKRTLEDKFINNTLMSRLDIILKERDYFKYECLKLNTQYQALTEEHKNLNSQLKNVNQQMAIYKHLLQDEKLRFKQTEALNLELKASITQITKEKPIHIHNSSSQAYLQDNQKNQLIHNLKKQLSQLKSELKHRNQQIRALKIRVENSENAITSSFKEINEKKHLQQIFKNCVEAWKRQINCKSKTSSRIVQSRLFSGGLKNSSNGNFNASVNGCEDLRLTNMSMQQFSNAKKKDLLKRLFTNGQFLQFIDQLLFDDECKVTIEKSRAQKWIQSNRKQLYNYLKQKRLFTRDRGNRTHVLMQS